MADSSVANQLNLFTHPGSLKKTFHDMCISLGVLDCTNWPDKLGNKLRNWSTKELTEPIKVLSLFSGGGGLDIGFHDAGFNVVKMLEIEKQFVETLKLNFGEGKYFNNTDILCQDIREYYPKESQSVDFIIGGPPCQTFSAAGRRAAGVQGTSDDRGTLFEEYVRILKTLSPKGFLFENVYGLLGAQNGDPWRQICKAFEKAGYNVFYRILDAADYGVPQHRERVFIVGTRKDKYFFPWPTHGPDSKDNQPYYPLSKAIEGIDVTEEEKGKVGGRYGKMLNSIPPGLNYSFYTDKMGHPNPVFAWRSKFSDFLYKADPFTPIRTLKAQGGQYTGPFHWENRRFSIRELKRLQTLPDDYLISGNKQTAIHQIGNSVPPQLARILALSILNQIFDVSLPFDLPYMDQNYILGFRRRKRNLTKVYQDKATTAINILQTPEKSKGFLKRAYTASLSNSFSWNIPSKDDEIPLYIKFLPNKREWRFLVSKQKRLDPRFSIIVTPNNNSVWPLPNTQVVLLGDELSPEIFTGLWKAFESELIRFSVKADLVQLCGYYQYPAAFSNVMEFEKDLRIKKEWRVIKAVTEGIGVGKILTSDILAQQWKVSVIDIPYYATFLRHLAYEIRNRNTNPQISEGEYLIPYSFPTLNPLSVQLRKSLEEANA